MKKSLCIWICIRAIILPVVLGQTLRPPVRIFTAETVLKMAYSPDGDMVGTSGQGILRIWNLNTGAVIRQLNDFQFEPVTLGTIRRVFFISPRLAGLSGRDELRVFDWETGRLAYSIKGETGQGVSVSRNGHYALRNESGLTEVIALATNKVVARLNIPYGPGIEVSRNGQFLFMPEEERIIKLSLPDGKVVHTYAQPDYGRDFEESEWIKSVRLIANEKIVVGLNYNRAIFWDAQTGLILKRSRIDDKDNAEITQDGRKVVETDDSTIVIREESSKFAPRYLTTIEGGDAESFILSPDSKKFLVSEGSRVYERDWTGKVLRRLGSVADQYVSACLSDDDKTLLLGTMDGMIKRFDLATGTYRGVHCKVDAPPVFLRLDKNGTELLIGDGRQVKVVDFKSGTVLRSFPKRDFRNLGLRVGKSDIQVHLLTGQCVIIHQFNTIFLATMRGDNTDYVALDERQGHFDGTPRGIDKLLLWDTHNGMTEEEQLRKRLYHPGLLASYLF